MKSLEGEAVLWSFPWNPVRAVLPFVFQRERLLANGWENARAIDMMKVYSFLPQDDVRRYHFGTQRSSPDAIPKVSPIRVCPGVTERRLQAGAAQGDTTFPSEALPG